MGRRRTRAAERALGLREGSSGSRLERLQVRREAAQAGITVTVPAKKSKAQQERSWANYRDRLAEADSPSQQVLVASQFLASVLKKAAMDEAAPLARRLVAQIEQVVRELQGRN